jgi:Mn2+/Fe2+ NRAMP family transporter
MSASGTNVVRPPFGSDADRRSALDRAHRGDIDGALGRLESFDTGPRLSLRRRVAALLAVMGPGVVVMVADNDAGGVSVYAQAGQDYGFRLFWPLLLLAGVLFVNQEMVARLGAVTGAGHARLIYERFGRRWGAFALVDLLALNLLTVVTELIGVGLALDYLGVSRYISVPLAALAVIVVTGSGSFRRWESVMYALVVMNLIAVPLAILSQTHATNFSAAAPDHRVAAHAPLLLFVIALVGTTVAPWQLFFQQSNVVDKRITARWLNYERVDTLIGTLLFTAGAVAVLAICAFAFAGTPLHGAFADAGTVARGLAERLGEPAGIIFALVLLNASVLGAAVVALSTSYSIGDATGLKHSLHRSWRDAPAFHGSFAAVVALAAAVVLVPGLPLGFVTTAVQALAGVLLPSAAVFLLLLCNDKAVLGPWTNPRWLNAVAVAVLGVLLETSALLTLSTLFPSLDLIAAAAALTTALIAVLAVLGVRARVPQARVPFVGTPRERATWTMPPIESLKPPVPSRTRTAGLVVLRVYLIGAAAMLAVRAAEILLAS